MVLLTATGVMTDRGGGPQVVHRPHHGFLLDDLTDILQRQHALVDPMQVDHVSLLKLGQAGDIRAAIGDVHFEEAFLLQVHRQPDTEALPQEMPLLAPGVLQPYHRQLVGALLFHQHLGLHTVVVQCDHQSVGGHGGATRILTCIDDQDSHFLILSI